MENPETKSDKQTIHEPMGSLRKETPRKTLVHFQNSFDSDRTPKKENIEDVITNHVIAISKALWDTFFQQGLVFTATDDIAMCWRRGDTLATTISRSIDGSSHHSIQGKRITELFSNHATLKIFHDLCQGGGATEKSWLSATSYFNHTQYDAIDVIVRKVTGFTGQKMVIYGVALDGLPVWHSGSSTFSWGDKRRESIQTLDQNRKKDDGRVLVWEARITPALDTSCPIASAAGSTALIHAPSKKEALRRWRKWRAWLSQQGRVIIEEGNITFTQITDARKEHPF